MVTEREAWYKAKITREHERAGIWEESLHKVVEEGEQLEEELRKSIKFAKDLRRQSRAIVENETLATIKQRSARTLSIGPPASEAFISALSPVTERDTPSAMSAEFSPGITITAPNTGYAVLGSPQANTMVVQSPPGIDDSDEEDDEFFDAIESGNLPNLVITEPLKSPPIDAHADWIDVSRFEGYKHLRSKLALSADNRPPVSLWAVLKGSIGKDLTKISFPVFFSMSLESHYS
jgi:hypothetical protein